MRDDRALLLAPLRAALHRLASDGLGSEQARLALVAHAERLRLGAGHLPQAARLADAVDRCAALPAPEAAVQLLKLLAAMQQLGGDPEVPPASPPPLNRRPLPPALRGFASTPIAPELLLELRTAFSRRVPPTHSVRELLANPVVVEDVRTWPLLEEGLAHPYLRGAATAALIRLGPSLAPRLRRRFNRRGDATDAARLEVLVAVERQDLTPLLLESARRGSGPVRRVALEALAVHSDLREDVREAVVLEAYEAAPEHERPELAKALALLGTDAALRCLWTLAASGTVSEHSLRELIAPGQLARWLHLGEEAVPGFSRTAAYFQLLEDWEAPEVRALLAQRSHDPDLRIRRLAVEARLASRDPTALQALVEHCLAEEDLLDVAVAALHRMGPGAVHRTLGPYVEAWLRAHEPTPGPSPLPHWLHVAHDLGTTEGEPRPDWWHRLETLIEATGRGVSGGSAPLQPAPIRERKEP